MPNPDFTGTVPSRRCETCKSWNRMLFDGKPSQLGVCLFYPVGVPVSFEMPNTIGVASVAPMTDLSVCSNWSRKEE